MKIKRLPSDFQVDEIIKLDIFNEGHFAVYQVQKENITTPSLLNYLAKWMKKSPNLFSHAGLKDKYGQTKQHISLKGDGPEQITTESFSAQRIGYSSEAIKSKHLIGNYFKIVIRDLNEDNIEKFKQNVTQLSRRGFLNYFDDQRFRSQHSVKNAFGFFLFRKEFDKALKIYIGEVLPFNKKIGFAICDQILREWGNWRAIIKLNLPENIKTIFTYLHGNPKDFQGAVYKIDYFDLRMMISAAQSFFWNEMLATYLKKVYPNNLKTKIGAWQTYFFMADLLPEFFHELNDLYLEMPNANWDSSNPGIKNSLQKILTRHKLQLVDLQLPGIKKIFTESFSRKVLILPTNFGFKKPKKDELYKNKYEIELAFQLSPGCYATMLIKQLFT